LVAAPDGTSYQPIVGAPDVYNTNAGVTSGSWLNDLFNAILSGFEHLLTPQNYTAATPSPTAVVAPVSPSTPVYSPGSTFTPTDNQLDVFQTSGWGAYAGRNPFFGNTVVQEFNSRRSMPSVAFGFSQWATIASSIIQAGASIGAAAATSALAPRSSAPSNNNAAVQAALLQQQLAQQQASKSNMTPWLIGGGVAVLALVLVVATKKK
jgi:hypothetical protein